MPTWSTHADIYRVIGFNVSIYRSVDFLIDKSPPKVRDVLPSENTDETLPTHFGSRKVEFPLMYNYVLIWFRCCKVSLNSFYLGSYRGYS